MMKSQLNLRTIPWHLIVIFLLLAIGIGTSGYFYYENQKEQIGRHIGEELSGIADLKVGEIVRWRKERLGNATVIFESFPIASVVQQYLENPKDSKLRRNVLTWMTSLQKNYEYERVLLLNKEAMVKLSIPEKSRIVCSHIQQSVVEVIQTKKVILTDFDRSEPNGSIHLSLVVPLLVQQRPNILPIGVLLLEINPYRFLYPFIQSWPTPSQTSETLLFHREGDEVVYLNELRHQKDTALNLRFPLSKAQLPAAMAIQGKEGVVEGLDYRGVPVVAAMRTIPESPWFLVAKVDREEIYQPIHEKAWLVAILSGLFIGCAAIALGLIWRQQRSQFYRKLYEGELQRQMLMQQLDYLTKYANDIIVLMDDQRRILDVNDRAVEAYGYTRDELFQRGGEDLRPPEFQPLFDAQIEQVNEHNGFLYETVHQKKDGTTFPVEVSSRPILVGEKKFYQSIIRDITERKHMEKSLRDSQAELSAIIENAPIVMLLVDRERRVRKANGAAIKFVSHPAEEMIGLRSGDALRCLHSLDDSRGCGFGHFCEKCTVRITVLDTLETGKSHYGVEAKLPFDLRGKPEGKHLLLSTIPLTVSEEQLALVCIEDITERKRAEEALRESEDRYRDLVENSQDLICTHDLQGHFLSINPAVAKLLGYDRSAILNMNVRDILAPEVRDRFGSYMDAIRREGSAKGLMLVQTATGERRILEYNNTLRTEGVASPIVRAINRDVTERKLAEQALRESQERYRILVETSPDAITLFDLKLNIIMGNRPALTLYGYERQEDVIGKSVLDFLASDQQARAKEDMEKVLETGSIGTVEYTLLKKDGTPFPAELKASLILDRQKKPVAILCVSRDITERKKAEEEKVILEEQLRGSQKMEAIGQLAGGIAHDFNNLLTVIKGYIQLSLGEIKEDDPLRGSLDEIKKAADRAADLTRQLLAFSRRQVMEMKVLDLNAVLKNLEKMLRRVIGEDIELITVPREDLGRIKTDLGQIEQVIMNLAVNARDAMPDGGKLTIETDNAALDEAYAQNHIAVKPGSYVMLSVSDTGIGMTSEVKERVFEPFFTTKQRGRGTGLGLSTVYGIVKQSGGNIWVYSEPGRGTTFKIYLPRVYESLGEIGETVVKEEFPRGSETILVVEDNEEVQKLAMRILQRQGYEVLGALEGVEAFLLCEKHEGPIDLLVTDVIMPKMSGRELAERIASIRPEIKVLYMSGYADNAIVHHGVLKEGMNYLQKPFTVEGLARKVREVLDKDSNSDL